MDGQVVSRMVAPNYEMEAQETIQRKLQSEQAIKQLADTSRNLDMANSEIYKYKFQQKVITVILLIIVFLVLFFYFHKSYVVPLTKKIDEGKKQEERYNKIMKENYSIAQHEEDLKNQLSEKDESIKILQSRNQYLQQRRQDNLIQNAESLYLDSAPLNIPHEFLEEVVPSEVAPHTQDYANENNNLEGDFVEKNLREVL